MVTASFLDRLRGTGPLRVELARSHGALGPIGRASGAGEDTRRSRPYDGYRDLPAVQPATSPDADAMARLRVRWQELHDACGLVLAAAERLSALGDPKLRFPVHPPAGRGIGWAEAPRCTRSRWPRSPRSSWPTTRSCSSSPGSR